MDYAERELYISRICSGYVKVNNLKIYPPSDDILYEANELSMECGGLDKEDVLGYLIDNGLWDIKKEERYNSIPKEIEDLKVSVFESVFKSNTKKQLKTNIKKLTEEYHNLISQRNSHDHLTLDYIRTFTKLYFIIENCTYLDKKIYDWSEYSILHVLNEYNSKLLDDYTLRRLAAEEPWMNLWVIKKQNGHIFDEPMSYEQRQLILYSKLFDSINESPDRPEDYILEDDDTLDGWLIVQKRKRENKAPTFHSSNPKIMNADEVFIVAETVEDAKKIDSMNDLFGSTTKRRRFKSLEKYGEMSWLQFPDMKDKITMELTNKQRQTFNDARRI